MKKRFRKLTKGEKRSYRRFVWKNFTGQSLLHKAYPAWVFKKTVSMEFKKAYAEGRQEIYVKSFDPGFYEDAFVHTVKNLGNGIFEHTYTAKEG